jgi:hypothetical protein
LVTGIISGIIIGALSNGLLAFFHPDPNISDNWAYYALYGAKVGANLGLIAGFLAYRCLALASVFFVSSGTVVLGNAPAYINAAKANGYNYFSISWLWDVLKWLKLEQFCWSINKTYLDLAMHMNATFLIRSTRQYMFGWLPKEIAYILGSGNGYKFVGDKLIKVIFHY